MALKIHDWCPNGCGKKIHNTAEWFKFGDKRKAIYKCLTCGRYYMKSGKKDFIRLDGKVKIYEPTTKAKNDGIYR